MARPSFRTKLTDAPAMKAEPDDAPFLGQWRSWMPQAILIIVATLWAFSPAFHGEWIWDDEVYVKNNSVIHDPLGFLKVWAHPDGQGDYYPLTQFVWWIEWQHVGKSTLVYHLTNVAFHLTGAFLLWNLLARIGLRLAWIGALIFAVHPVMVESVAWISELKNTLSLPPLLLSMICWLEWQGGAPKRFWRWALLCFVLSLLAKITGLMLPFVLLGQTWAKRGKIERKDILAVAPFFLVAVVFACATLLPHRTPNTPPELQPVWTLGGALAAVGWGVTFMLGKCFWPVDLLPIYGGYGLGPQSLLDILPWLGFGGLFVLLGRARNDWGRVALLGLGFFVLNLVPIIEFIFLHYTIMNWSVDHLLYLPIIGLIGAVVAALGALDAWLIAASRVVERVAVAALIALMAWKTYAYAGYFVDAEKLWALAVLQEPNSSLIRQNYATALFDHKKFDLAVPQLQRVLQIDPRDDQALLQLGEIALNRDDRAQAEVYYRQALKIAPKTASPYVNLGSLKFQAGQNSEAIAFYRQAIAITPESAQIQYDLGNVLLQAGDLAGATEHLEKAERLDPKLAMTHENLAVALGRSGHAAAAVAEFQLAVQLEPQKSTAHSNLALALVQVGDIQDAIKEYQTALQLDPGNAKASDALAKLQLFEMKQTNK
jgi:Flp pilus assembly protein TadD